ncbi:MAG: outer membrane protein OmpA-like peptidoglycan-associated protein [Crocinitomicaceae bacterium]|jgi:outer membrane protein OmpA-like peptidoglycan-associated protein
MISSSKRNLSHLHVTSKKQQMKFILKASTGLLCLFVTASAFGQGNRLKFADKQYDNMAYYYAYMAYEDVLERGVDSAIVAKKIAVSYRKTNNLAKADEWYGFLYRKGNLSKSELLDYARLSISVGDYVKSQEIVNNYISKNGPDDESNSLVEFFNSHEDLKVDKDRFILNSTSGNSSASEMSVAYLKDSKVLLSSSKKSSVSVNRIQAWTGGHYYNLYTSETDSEGNILKLKPLKGKANTNYNDGPACYDSVNNIVYFTRNSYIKKTKSADSKGVTQLKIYKGTYTKKGLSNIEELAFNSDAYSCGHPSISGDGKTLYFSSDRPGGHGGADIYKVNFNENFISSEPVNLGAKLNTSKDELFPFVHPKENLIFFSSGGHQGLGGQDVFVAKMGTNGDIRKIENVGVPINTAMDDFSFINNANQTSGYVASNRSGGEGNDDIYSFKQLIPFRSSAIISGTTKDLISSLNLEGVSMALVDINGDVIDEVLSDEVGDFEMYLESIDQNFKLVAMKDGYILAEEKIIFDENAEGYNQEMQLMPIIDYYLAGKVHDKTTKELLEDVTITISDLLADIDLADQITGQDGRFNSENIDYKYGDTVRYEIVLSKPGYISKTYIIRDFLSRSPEIYVSGEIGISLTPIEKGIDVGVEVGLSSIYFDLNSSELRSEAKGELDKIVDFLNENGAVGLELGAHTDCRAKDNYNLWLSKRRAKNSANYIKSRISNPSRITYKGYGESVPVNDCDCDNSLDDCSDEEHQLNRRTEFIILKTAK